MVPEWIFIVIVAFFWIVNALLRRNEESRTKASGPTSDERSSVNRARRQPSDIDRFLAEVRRRREAQEKQGGATPAPQAIREATPQRPVATPRTMPRPLPTAQPASRQVRAPQPGERRMPARSASTQATSAPTVQANSRPRQNVEPQPVDAIPLAVPAAPTIRPMPVDAVVAPQPQPLDPFLAMLRNPETLVAAMMIREILGPPVCGKRRR